MFSGRIEGEYLSKLQQVQDLAQEQSRGELRALQKGPLGSITPYLPPPPRAMVLTLEPSELTCSLHAVCADLKAISELQFFP